MSDDREDSLRKKAKANLNPKGWEALLEGVERIDGKTTDEPSPDASTVPARRAERHVLKVRDESGRTSEHFTSGKGRRDPEHAEEPTAEEAGGKPTPAKESRPLGKSAAKPSGPQTVTAYEPGDSIKDMEPAGARQPGQPVQRVRPGPPAAEVKTGKSETLKQSDKEHKRKEGFIGGWIRKQPTLQKVQQYYRSLSTRDQRLVAFTFVGLSLLFIYLLILEPMFEKRDLLDHKVARKKADLAEMVRLRSSVVQDRGGMERIKSVIKERGKAFSVFAYLEQLAAKAEMKDRIVSIKPQRETPVGPFKESLVSVKLSNIGMEELTRFLYQIETSEDLLYIKNFKIKKVTAGKGQGMDVTISVGTLVPG
jgi:general secretion pathway protein M